MLAGCLLATIGALDRTRGASPATVPGVRRGQAVAAGGIGLTALVGLAVLVARRWLLPLLDALPHP